MTVDCLDMLRRLDNSVVNLDARVRTFLRSEGTRQVVSSGTGTTVHQALLVWRTRYDLNKDTDHPLLGALDLLQRFAGFAPQRKIEEIGFVGDTDTCILFFDWSTSHFVGYILTRRRTPVEETARREKQQHRQSKAGALTTPAAGLTT